MSWSAINASNFAEGEVTGGLGQLIDFRRDVVRSGLDSRSGAHSSRHGRGRVVVRDLNEIGWEIGLLSTHCGHSRGR